MVVDILEASTFELGFLYLGFSVFLLKKSGLIFKSPVATLLVTVSTENQLC